MPAHLGTCRHCAAPVAWANRAYGGSDDPQIPLNPEPVPLATAHPAAPLYVMRRSDGRAVPVADVHRPPGVVYVLHRCSQWRAARQWEELRAVNADLDEWRDEIAERDITYAAAPVEAPRRLA